MKNFFVGFKKGFQDFGYNIVLIVNTVLLFLVYLVGVGITSLCAKLLGKHFLEMNLDKDSYWHDLNLKKKSIEEYFRQF